MNHDLKILIIICVSVIPTVVFITGEFTIWYTSKDGGTTPTHEATGPIKQIPYVYSSTTEPVPNIIPRNYVTFDDGCKTGFDYNNVTFEVTNEYLVSGNCTSNDMSLLDRYATNFMSIEKSQPQKTKTEPILQYNSPELKMNVTSACPDGIVCPQLDEKDALTSTSLTEGTDVCIVGFNCPNNETLTEATNCPPMGPCNPSGATQTDRLLAMNYCIKFWDFQDPMTRGNFYLWMPKCVHDTLESTKSVEGIDIR